MAENKKSVLVYVDWISTFEELEDIEAGKLIKHFFRYINDRHPEAPDRLTKLMFEPIKQSLKRDLVKYEEIRNKNKENALLRWNKNNATASERIQTNSNHADSVSDNDSVIDIDSVKEKEKEINEIYSLYPSNCPVKNSSTGKSLKNKDKIKSLLTSKSKDEIISIITRYTKECKENKIYMKNFSTFLNNLPDYSQLQQQAVSKNRMVHYKLFGHETTHVQKAYDENLKLYGEDKVQFLNYVEDGN